MSLRLPNGASLLLVGSGIYWILSSQLIGSFTSLAPGLLAQSQFGIMTLFLVGIACTVIGLVTVRPDLSMLNQLFRRREGWVYTMPIVFSASDIYTTLIGLSSGFVEELNPFVASALRAGPQFTIAFVSSYLMLAEGVGLLMVWTGKKLHGTSRLSKLPFSVVSGVGSFGPFSNVSLIILGSVFIGYAFGLFAAVFIASMVYAAWRN